MGEFSSRADALNYMVNARESGFTDARIISGYELTGDDGVDIQTLNLLYTQSRFMPSPPLLQSHSVDWIM
ncbi:MAG: hypothetical protein R2744_04810 [Bacteroidales bacterium]